MFNFLITNAGWAKLAQVGTLGPVVLDRIQIGSAGYAPTVSQTSLISAIKNLSITGSTNPNNKTIHITAEDSSSDVYVMNEIGVFTPDNTLFAVYSNPSTSIMTKSAGSLLLLAFDLLLDNVTPGSVVVGETGFSYPAATEVTKGVAFLASATDLTAGSDDTKIVTPAKLRGSSAQATASLRGTAMLASSAEVDAGTENTKIVTPLRLRSTQFLLSQLSNSSTQTLNVRNRLVKAYINFAANIVLNTGVVTNAPTNFRISTTAGSNLLRFENTNTDAWWRDWLGCSIRLPSIGGVTGATFGGAVVSNAMRCVNYVNRRNVDFLLPSNATSTASLTGTGAVGGWTYAWASGVRSSFNVTSLTRVAAGRWTIVFTVPFPDTDYVMFGGGKWDDSNNDGWQCPAVGVRKDNDAYQPGQCTIQASVYAGTTDDSWLITAAFMGRES